MAPDRGLVSLDRASRILAELGHRADNNGFTSLASQEQVVLLAWVGLGVIGNGGFRLWYESKGIAETRALASAFRTLELSDVADACESSLLLFPNGIASDLRERMLQLRSIDWKSAFVRAQQSKVYQLEFDVLLERISAYMSDRAKYFVTS